MEVRDLITGKVVNPGEYEPDDVELRTGAFDRELDRMSRQEAIDLIHEECAKIQAAQAETLRAVAQNCQAIVNAIAPIMAKGMEAFLAACKPLLDTLEVDDGEVVMGDDGVRYRVGGVRPWTDLRAMERDSDTGEGARG